MTFKKLYFFCCVLMCQLICAQNDTISLEEVNVSDSQLRNFSGMQSVIRLNDSVIQKNRPSLTSLLQFNSVIFFKENGFGMVSSPSFRGTSAQQTAVVWNGININSQFNGQTDFNAVTTSNYNSISVKAGGGSVVYGSSAIGGSIHLNNELDFNSSFSNRLYVEYGSFNTLGLNYNVNASSDKWSLQAGFSRNSSDNDFDYPNGRKNLNGEFENASFNANIGYKIDSFNYLKFFSQIYNDERYFALLTPTDSKTKYRNFNTRNMLEWVGFYKMFVSKLKVAHLSEQYQYYGNIANDSYAESIAETVILKYDALFKINGNITLNGIFDYTQTDGRGDDIGKNKREIGSAALLFKHILTDKLQYELGIRTEITDSYESPLLFSAGTSYEISEVYKIKINGSRNFRIPTFNDLYWLEGGNQDLKPETSLQAELGNEFTFRNTKLTVTGYAMKITDMIQWLPGTETMWLPQNVNEVETYGVEAIMNWNKKFGRHNLNANASYAYTISENAETNLQLIYVPYHKATAAVAYSYRHFSANYQMLFNGEVFTRGDNNPIYNLDAYSVSNINADYTFPKLFCTVGFRVLNLWDEEYQVVERRVYPGRNYNFYLTFNF